MSSFNRHPSGDTIDWVTGQNIRQYLNDMFTDILLIISWQFTIASYLKFHQVLKDQWPRNGRYPDQVSVNMFIVDGVSVVVDMSTDVHSTC